MAKIKKVGTTGQINGIVITENNVDEILQQLEKSIDRSMTIIGMKCEKYAKAKCPVGTPESTGIKGYRGGTLRNSITFKAETAGNKGRVIVGSNVEYAPYVELGTGTNFEPPPEWEQFDAKRGSGMNGGIKPRHFLKDAVQDHIPEYKRIIEAELKK